IRNTATNVSDTLSLRDALPIYERVVGERQAEAAADHRAIEHEVLAARGGVVHAAGEQVDQHGTVHAQVGVPRHGEIDLDRLHLLARKSTRLNSSHVKISYAVFC